MDRERGLGKRKAKCHVAETLITDGHRDIFIAEVPECVLLGRYSRLGLFRVAF